MLFNLEDDSTRTGGEPSKDLRTEDYKKIVVKFSGFGECYFRKMAMLRHPTCYGMGHPFYVLTGHDEDSQGLSATACTVPAVFLEVILKDK